MCARVLAILNEARALPRFHWPAVGELLIMIHPWANCRQAKFAARQVHATGAHQDLMAFESGWEDVRTVPNSLMAAKGAGLIAAVQAEALRL